MLTGRASCDWGTCRRNAASGHRHSRRFPVFLSILALASRTLILYHAIEAKVNVSISNLIQVLIVNVVFLILLFLTIKACVADARRRGEIPSSGHSCCCHLLSVGTDSVASVSA